MEPYSLTTLNWLDYRGVPGGPETMPIWPLDEVLDAATGAGFSMVGLDDRTIRRYLESGHKLEDLTAMLSSRQLGCTDIGVLRIGRPGVLEQAKELARLATLTGAGVCIAAVAKGTPSAVAVRDIRGCCSILGRAGTRVAVEFLPYGELRTLADAVALCQSVGSDRCGVLLDTLHFFRSGSPWRLLRSLDRTQIALVQVNDAQSGSHETLASESRVGRRLPGSGDLPIAEFADTLRSTGYDGAISVEVLSEELRSQPPATGARLMMRSLCDIWPTGPETTRRSRG